MACPILLPVFHALIAIDTGHLCFYPKATEGCRLGKDSSVGFELSLRKGVGNIMRFTGCSLKEAIQMSSTNQARIFGWNDRGEIAKGKRACPVYDQSKRNRCAS
jgi:N-acetylglucosamine-6-phosphate deacetylase